MCLLMYKIPFKVATSYIQLFALQLKLIKWDKIKNHLMNGIRHISSAQQPHI